MTDDDIKKMIAEPGLYFVDVKDVPIMGSVLVVSQNGKLYALRIDQELRTNRFHPDAYVSKKVDIPGSEIGFVGDVI